MTRRKRTKKEFTDYNDYKDRSFGLKWSTAFALSELSAVIGKAQSEELRTVKEYPKMTRDEIDTVLQHAFLKSKLIAVQRDERDDHGRLFESVEGRFAGIADEQYLYLEDQPIAWDTIRHIRLL